MYSVSFFFQAEDGIRDYKVTGVQTCALPILATSSATLPGRTRSWRCWTRQAYPAWPATTTPPSARGTSTAAAKIGRASCRERVRMSEVATVCEIKKKRDRLQMHVGECRCRTA